MGQGGADFFVHIRQFSGSEKYSLQNQTNIADGVNFCIPPRAGPSAKSIQVFCQSCVDFYFFLLSCSSGFVPFHICFVAAALERDVSFWVGSSQGGRGEKSNRVSELVGSLRFTFSASTLRILLSVAAKIRDARCQFFTEICPGVGSWQV